MGPHIVAVDVGTSGVRSSVFDGRGRRLDRVTAVRSCRLRVAEPGMAEMAPRALLRATRSCLAETLDGLGAARGGRRVIGAVSMSCYWHSLLGVDADGEPLTPIYTWADARCHESAARLRRQHDPADLHRRTGCMVHTSFWPAKLLWLRRLDRSAFSRVRHWLSPGEWLFRVLAGVDSVAHGMATGTGLYDPSKLDWDDELLRVVGVDREQLGRIDDRPAPARRGGASSLRAALWVPAIGDGAAGNLGCGAVARGTGAINLGTSAAVRVVRAGRTARAPLGLFAYRVDRSRYLVGGAISNAGNLRAWCERELSVPDGRALDRALARRARPRHGLTVLPFWTAERAPTWRDDLAGVVHGLRQSTTSLDLAQAAIEAGHHRLAQILERLPEGRRPLEIIVSGGGSRSAPGLRRLANVLGRDLFACADPEASLSGAMVHAHLRLGREAPPPPATRRVEHDPAIAAEFAVARASQARLEALFGCP